MMPSTVRTKANKKNMLGYVKKYLTVDYAKKLIFDPSKLSIVACFIILAEVILNIYVIERVKYTEIDWVAYMQECEGFLNGTWDYSYLKGDTGPLVYPAGFLYVYTALYYITSRGTAVRLAQYLFMVLYLIQLTLVLRIYCKSRKVPPYVVAFSVLTSYRIHSIYVLRMFNDPVAMALLWGALNMYLDSWWTLASVLLSLAVSVKMNILLFAPGIFLLYLVSLGLKRTLVQLSICAGLQVVLGAPFLLSNPVAYLRGSFDLGRVFEHKWTVNYRFLDRAIFESRLFHLTLLCVHILLLFVFFPSCYKYLQNYVRLRCLEKQLRPQIDAQNREVKSTQKNKPKKSKEDARKRQQKVESNIEGDGKEKLTPDQEKFLASFEQGLKKTSGVVEESVKPEPSPTHFSVHFDKATQLALLPIFLSNFIGIVCARSLHYQFYVWYFHTLPYLAWSADLTTPVRFLILIVLEFCWNAYPSTLSSCLALHACHIVLMKGLYKRMKA